MKKHIGEERVFVGIYNVNNHGDASFKEGRTKKAKGLLETNKMVTNLKLSILDSSCGRDCGGRTTPYKLR